MIENLMYSSELHEPIEAQGYTEPKGRTLFIYGLETL